MQQLQPLDRERRHQAAAGLGALCLGLMMLSVLLGCAVASVRNDATITARSIHDAIEIGAPRWEAYVDAKVSECEAQKLPNRSAGEKCLGPAAAAPDVATLMEAITAGQLVLFVALSENRSDPEVRAALVQLRQHFAELVGFWVDAGVCKGQCAAVAKLLLPRAGG